MPGYQGWKHKDIDIGKKINRDIKKKISIFCNKHFGVEIVDPNNNSRLSKEMELTIINNKNTKQMRDITEYLFEDAKKYLLNIKLHINLVEFIIRKKKIKIDNLKLGHI